MGAPWELPGSSLGHLWELFGSSSQLRALTRLKREDMMQKLSQQEKEEINQLPKEDLYCFKFGMLYTKDIDYYMDYL